MGVNRAIKIILLQKDPATLTKAVKETMKLEVINDTNSPKNKIASLVDMDDKDLGAIDNTLDDLTIKMINSTIEFFNCTNQQITIEKESQLRIVERISEEDKVGKLKVNEMSVNIQKQQLPQAKPLTKEKNICAFWSMPSSISLTGSSRSTRTCCLSIMK